MSATGLIVIGIIAVLAFWGWRKARLSGARAIALSEYAKKLSLAEAMYVHDLAVSGFGVFAAPIGDPMKDIELASALRDRVDELEGRAFGPVNKAAIRATLAKTAASRGKPFRYGIQPSPQDEERCGDHYTMMGRVYMYLDKAPSLPERE